MEWLNYHHLLYFWMTAREGTIAAAAKKLRLAQPTISSQIRALEESLGHELFSRVGRRMKLTESGRLVYRYADEIFSLGTELADTLRGRQIGSPLRLTIGISDVVPKLVAYRLLEPATQLPEQLRLVCEEGKPKDLLLRLATFELDLVITDAPVGSETHVKAYNHLLGECGVTIFGTAAQAAKVRRNFPESLDGAPFLFPRENTTLHRELRTWLEDHDLRPVPVAEFEDSALLKVFGQAGLGLFAGPTAIEKQIVKQYGVRVAGRLDEVRERFFAISVERRVKHPAVAKIVEQARTDIFA